MVKSKEISPWCGPFDVNFIVRDEAFYDKITNREVENGQFFKINDVGIETWIYRNDLQETNHMICYVVDPCNPFSV